MTKEAPRPFSDTQKAYRQGVEDLIAKKPLIKKDEASWVGLSRRDNFGVPLSLPIDKKKIPKNLRTHNIAQIYLNGEETREDIGDMLGVTSQSLGTKKAVRRVLEAAPQEGLEFDSLNFKKPRGVVNEIREAVAKGASHEDLLIQGFDGDQIATARHILSNRHDKVFIPRITTDWSDTLKVLGDPAAERIVVRELILEIPRGVYDRYRNSKRNPEGLFFSLKPLVKEAGLSFDAAEGEFSIIVDYLNCRLIPLGYSAREIQSGRQKGKIQRDNFTTKNFVDETIDLLRTAKGEHFDRMRARAERRNLV